MITALWSKIFHNWFVKCFVAGIVALGILSLFSVFYYNPPIHVGSESGATDYTRQSDTFWSRGTEGFASGTTDENGYNNAYEVAEGTPVDVLLMGSSQTEGLYVDEKENMGYLLNEMFAENGENRYVYNIGMSAHTFLRNVSNLKYALETYQPTEYVVLETDFVSFASGEVDAALQDQMSPLESYQNGLLYESQKIPYVKLLYQQYKDYSGQASETDDSAQVQGEAAYDFGKMSELLRYVKEQADEYGVTAMIYYYPSLSLEEDGSLATSTDDEMTANFAGLCEENGIAFVDMTEAFEREYEENHHIVSGFSNTAECYGHLNRYGHKLIAEAIYQEIEKGQ